MQLVRKKWRVAPNSGIYGASRTASDSSSVQLGTANSKQRQRTQNIAGMDFPTYLGVWILTLLSRLGIQLVDPSVSVSETKTANPFENVERAPVGAQSPMSQFTGP